MSIIVNYPHKPYSVRNSRNFNSGSIDVQIILTEEVNGLPLQFEIGPVYNISSGIRNAIMIYLKEKSGNDINVSQESSFLINKSFNINLDNLIAVEGSRDINFSRDSIHVYVCHQAPELRNVNDVVFCQNHVPGPATLASLLLEESRHFALDGGGFFEDDCAEAPIFPTRYGMGVIRN